MQKPPELSEPAFTKILQDALSRGGQVVVVQPPAPPLPPPRDRDEAELVVVFCTLFSLQAREGLLLAKLMSNDYQTLEELRVAAAPKRTPNSMRVFLSLTCRKLAPHGISIKNARGIGYYLRKEVREEIHRRLAQHDAESIPKRQPKAETPNASHVS
jgi:hypothetical protein